MKRVWSKLFCFILCMCVSLTCNMPSVSLAASSGYKFVNAGRYMTVAIREDGTLKSWGADYTEKNDSHQVVSDPETIGKIKTLAAGVYQTIVVKEDGTIAAWGWNDNGECSYPAGLNNVKAVAAGYFHSMALKEDGTIVAWGLNTDGQCTIPAGLTKVKAIAAGGNFSVALKEDGTVVSWGKNDLGQCNVPQGLTNVKAISAGYEYAVALKEDGTVVAWGFDRYGAVAVPEGLNKVKEVSAGYYHVVALKDDGNVIAWGQKVYGECTIPDGLSDVKSVSAGGAHTVALKEDGTIVAWGYNGYLQCGIPADITFDLFNLLPTKEKITVTAHTNIGVLNTTTHTFSKNGSYIFSATDPDGLVTYKTLKITNIISEQPATTATAVTTRAKVLVDGKPTDFNAYTINNNNYFKLRDLAYVLNGTSKQFEVTWDGAKKAINLKTKGKYTLVGGEMAISADISSKKTTLSTAQIFIDGNLISLTIYTINNNNFFKLRDLGSALDFGVTWDGTSQKISISSTTGYTEE